MYTERKMTRQCNTVDYKEIGITVVNTHLDVIYKTITDTNTAKIKTKWIQNCNPYYISISYKGLNEQFILEAVNSHSMIVRGDMLDINIKAIFNIGFDTERPSCQGTFVFKRFK